MEAGALASSSLFAYDLPDAFQFLRHLLIGGDDGIKGICNLASESRPGAGKAYRKISIPHGLQAGENHTEISRRGLGNGDRIPVALVLIVLAFVQCAIGNAASRVSAISLHTISWSERGILAEFGLLRRLTAGANATEIRPSEPYLWARLRGTYRSKY